MYRIDNSTAVPSLPTVPAAAPGGYFTQGNLQLAIPATIVDAWWANMLQEEILAVVVEAGITPSKVDNTQLLKALNFLYIGPDALDAYLKLPRQYAEHRPVAGGRTPHDVLLEQLDRADRACRL